jgi:hypothetical protein
MPSASRRPPGSTASSRRSTFAQADRNFLAIRSVLDATAAAQQRTAELLAVLIDERGGR